jgi:putative polymerase
LTSTHFLARSSPALTNDRDFRSIAFLLILSAVSFNAVLCFINTNIVSIDSNTVILSEMFIVGAAIIACYRSLNHLNLILILGTILFTLILSQIRISISPGDGLDIKIVRDLLIPIIFFLVGQRIKDLKIADSIVFKITGLVLILALFEYFFLDTFLKYFSIAQYYIARGTLEETNAILDYAGGLMANGIRPPDQGRELPLPFLGNHRVSSIFLEPISLGNFGCIVTLWALVRSSMERRFYFWTILSALALIGLSDTRFDAYFLVLGIIMLILPLYISTPAAAAMPIVIILGLMIFAITSDNVSDFITGLGTYHRLLYSGHVLVDFDILNWLGMSHSRLQTFDAGYGYIISNAGIVVLLLFGWLFMSLKGPDRYFYSFRNASVAYYATLFCISASQLTIKTASLHWLLIGTLAAAKHAGNAVISYQSNNQMQLSMKNASGTAPKS